MRHAVELRGYENELLSQMTQAQVLVLPLLSSVIDHIRILEFKRNHVYVFLEGI